MSSGQSGDSNEQESTADVKLDVVKPDISEEDAESEARDLRRKTEDWGVYKYYLGAIGVKKMAAFLIFTLINVLSATLSRR